MKIQHLITATLLLTFASAPAATTETITVQDVIARYIDALGGEEKISRCESRHIQATFDQSGMTGQLDMYSAEPNSYRMKLTITGVGDFEEGVLDSVGWSHDMMSGPQLMTGNHLASTLLRTRHNMELYYFDLYDTVTLEGEVEFDGVTCYKLRLDTPWGSSFEFFDIETGLLRGSESEQPLAGGSKVTMSLVVHEYGEYEGRLYPVKTSQNSPMGKQTIIITDVTHGSVEPKVFQPPEPVLALLKAN